MWPVEANDAVPKKVSDSLQDCERRLAPVADEAVISHRASARPDLDRSSLRFHPGPRYPASEEQFVCRS